MPSAVIFEVVAGALKGEWFVFRGAARILVGRSRRCDLSLPNDPLHWDVSRVHCLIEVRPPYAIIRDVGSRNGTYVNGTNIGQLASRLGPDVCVEAPAPRRRLHDGDRIRIGATVFRIDIRPAVDAGDDATLCLGADAIATDR